VCIIGYKELETALAGLEGEIEAEIRWRPFELNPDLPEEGEDAARLKLPLFDAHFQQRRNISDREELAEIAASVGLDREVAAAALEDESLAEGVQQEEMDAIGKGISSIPMILVEGRFMIPGGQDPETYAAYLRKAVTRMTDAA
jgi:predicted DsbA family dithiol-disulfide isomerase